MTAETKALNECCKALEDFALGTWVDGVDATLSGPITIRGTWYHVDPSIGLDSNDGLTKETALKSIEVAYALCTSGAGDGIILHSAGTTTALTTSYLKKTLTWSKHGITVVGDAAPTRMYGRARISNTEVTTSSSVISQEEHSIDRESGSFITDGWEVGMTGDIADSGANNGATFTVTVVTALSLTVSETLTAQTKAQVGACVLLSYIDNLITVSGNNNRFINTHIANYGSNALSIGGVQVSGHRNYFGRCHIVGAGHATPAATTGAYDVFLNAAEETTFEGCTFGTDTIIRAAANGNIRFDGGCWRTRFYDCDIVSYSATAGKGAIISVDATALSGVQVFARCRFINWNENGITNIDSVFIGTKPNSGAFLMDSCSVVGWTAWDAVAGNDMVYIANSAAVASGGGGLATTV